SRSAGPCRGGAWSRLRLPSFRRLRRHHEAAARHYRAHAALEALHQRVFVISGIVLDHDGSAERHAATSAWCRYAGAGVARLGRCGCLAWDAVARALPVALLIQDEVHRAREVGGYVAQRVAERVQPVLGVKESLD